MRDKKPTKPGVYWYLHPHITNPMLVEVKRGHNNNVLYENLTMGSSPMDGDKFPNGSWAGPLPQPEVETVNGVRVLAKMSREFDWDPRDILP